MRQQVKADPWFDLHRVDVKLGPAARILALAGVTLQIGAGERVALVGANGSGKSTLLRCLHGVQAVHAGQYRVAPSLRMAMLFQRPHMMRMSVLHNVALGLWLQGMGWRQARSRAAEALQRVRLEHLARRNARALSGGQQQRLALARAWAMEPDVWFLDEPTASLDPNAKREVEALIAEFATEAVKPVTLIFSSHNLGQVKRLATRVIYLEQGRVLADLPVEDFFNDDVLENGYPQAHAFVKGETS